MRYNLVTDLEKQQPDIHDRGLHYGDGLFETLLLDGDKIHFWALHYRRLSTSAARLNIGCPDRSWFERHLTPYLELKQKLIIKILLTRGSGGRALKLPDEMSPTVYILHYPCKNNFENQSIKAIISDITLPKNKALAGLKHLNRLNYVLATQALKQHQHFNEALLCDDDGYVIESIVHNIFFVKNNELCTPNLSHSGVEGVMRQLILEKMIQSHQAVKIGRFTRQDLFSASECFLCNSVQGIRPVLRIQETEFAAGPVTRQLQEVFHGVTGH